MRRVPFARARAAASSYDFLGTYVDDLPSVVDLAAIKEAGIRIGADPLGNVLLLVGFALVVMGADLFGMITSPGVRMLGLISYDLYVVHGIVYYLAMRSWGGAHLVTVSRYIPEAMLCMTAAVLLSVLLHFFVERPTMLISERIARRQAGDGRKSKLVTV